MRDTLQEFKNFFRKGDMVLLILCLATSAFGCLVVASATNADKFGASTRYMAVQLGATGIGILMYAIMSSIDAIERKIQADNMFSLELEEMKKEITGQ